MVKQPKPNKSRGFEPVLRPNNAGTPDGQFCVRWSSSRQCCVAKKDQTSISVLSVMFVEEIPREIPAPDVEM